jgi:hypothetical protein
VDCQQAVKQDCIPSASEGKLSVEMGRSQCLEDIIREQISSLALRKREFVSKGECYSRVDDTKEETVFCLEWGNERFDVEFV